jgi:hypothetical protein
MSYTPAVLMLIACCYDMDPDTSSIREIAKSVAGSSLGETGHRLDSNVS